MLLMICPIAQAMVLDARTETNVGLRGCHDAWVAGIHRNLRLGNWGLPRNDFSQRQRLRRRIRRAAG